MACLVPDGRGRSTSSLLNPSVETGDMSGWATNGGTYTSGYPLPSVVCQRLVRRRELRHESAPAFGGGFSLLKMIPAYEMLVLVVASIIFLS